jgi:hypothetical protein
MGKPDCGFTASGVTSYPAQWSSHVCGVIGSGVTSWPTQCRSHVCGTTGSGVTLSLSQWRSCYVLHDIKKGIYVAFPGQGLHVGGDLKEDIHLAAAGEHQRCGWGLAPPRRKDTSVMFSTSITWVPRSPRRACWHWATREAADCAAVSRIGVSSVFGKS